MAPFPAKALCTGLVTFGLNSTYSPGTTATPTASVSFGTAVFQAGSTLYMDLNRCDSGLAI